MDIDRPLDKEVEVEGDRAEVAALADERGVAVESAVVLVLRVEMKGEGEVGVVEGVVPRSADVTAETGNGDRRPVQSRKTKIELKTTTKTKSRKKRAEKTKTGRGGRSLARSRETKTGRKPQTTTKTTTLRETKKTKKENQTRTRRNPMELKKSQLVPQTTPIPQKNSMPQKPTPQKLTPVPRKAAKKRLRATRRIKEKKMNLLFCGRKR